MKPFFQLERAEHTGEFRLILWLQDPDGAMCMDSIFEGTEKFIRETMDELQEAQVIPVYTPFGPDFGSKGQHTFDVALAQLNRD